MPGQRPILAMSFVASLGITAIVLACTLPKHESNFWPLLVMIFYFILPVPIMISKRVAKETFMLGINDGSSGKIRDIALFLTSGIMVSSMALPIVLARSPSEKPLIAPISCFLVEIGNALCYTTLGLFCMYFKPFGGI